MPGALNIRGKGPKGQYSSGLKPLPRVASLQGSEAGSASWNKNHKQRLTLYLPMQKLERERADRFQKASRSLITSGCHIHCNAVKVRDNHLPPPPITISYSLVALRFNTPPKNSMLSNQSQQPTTCALSVADFFTWI